MFKSFWTSIKKTSNASASNAGAPCTQWEHLEVFGEDLVRRMSIYAQDTRKDPNDCRRGVQTVEFHGWISSVKATVTKELGGESEQMKSIGAAEWRHKHRQEGLNKGAWTISDSLQIDVKYLEELLAAVRLGKLLRPRTPEGGTVINVSVQHNSGILNIANVIDRATQTVQSAPTLSSVRKSEWVVLMAELRQALSSVSSGKLADAELVAELADTVAKELEKKAPRRKALEISSGGLIDAAKALSTVAPAVIEVAQRIARFVCNPV